MEASSVISQSEMMQKTVPLIKDQGQVYRKFKNVLAKKATGGEKIATVTSDGIETTNTAEPGDMIVRNLTEAGEKYIVKAEKFQDRYEFDKEAEDGFSQYNPLGKIQAIEVNEEVLERTGFKTNFQFTAPWGQPEVVNHGDFLVCPLDYSEVYRIARKEFHETYELNSGT